MMCCSKDIQTFTMIRSTGIDCTHTARLCCHALSPSAMHMLSTFVSLHLMVVLLSFLAIPVALLTKKTYQGHHLHLQVSARRDYLRG